MKRLFILVVFLLALSGCAYMSYEKDGIKVTTFRCLTASESISADVGGARVEVKGQANNTDIVKTAIDTAVKAAIR